MNDRAMTNHDAGTCAIPAYWHLPDDKEERPAEHHSASDHGSSPIIRTRRWTQQQIDDINARAKREYEDMKDLWD